MRSGDKRIYIRRDEAKKIDWVLRKYEHPIIVYDVETTGVRKNDFIVQIAALKLKRNESGKYRIAEALNEYIKPPIAMPEEATYINHLTDEMLEGKPAEAEVFPKIKAFFENFDENNGPVVIGYNSTKFDDNMMDAMWMRQEGNHFMPKRTIDVMRLSMELVERKDLCDESFTLENVARLYGILNGEETLHRADEDVKITGKLFWILARDFRENFLFDDEKEKRKPKAMIIGAYPFKKSKTSNHIMLSVKSSIDGHTLQGRIHYDIYNRRYVEDEGSIMEHCDMYHLSKDADRMAGGDIAKYKARKEKIA